VSALRKAPFERESERQRQPLRWETAMDEKLPVVAAIRKAFSESDTPVEPGAFYIQSNIGNSNWVLTATPVAGVQRVRLARKTGALTQLWMRQDDPRGGCFLKNVGTGLVLEWHGRGVECTLERMDEGQPHQLWVPSAWGNWMALYAVNWNQALNVFGNSWDQNNGIGLWEFSGGQPNEIWQLNPEHGAITVESMTYDMSRAKVDLSVPPALNVGTAVDNRDGSLEIKTTVKLNRRVTTSRRVTYDERSQSMLRTLTTLGFKAGFGNIVEVTGSTAVETQVTKEVSYNETSAQTTTVDSTISTEVRVPAHAQFEFAILVRYGRVDVPYTAVVSRALPGGGTERSELTGIYTNIDMIRQEVVSHDITGDTPKPAQLVATSAERELAPA
jgi:hypothetical protein